MRVLIAEDDPVIALALVERIRALGHEPVGPVADGKEAVREALATKPDLYLFDIEMPELDGLSAAAELAARGLSRPIVVITGVDDPTLIERSVVTGAGAFLTKPLDTRELEAAISLAAARHGELEALQGEVAQTRQALEERKVVERAKGLLMKALGLAEPDAFRRLQLAARERNMRLVDVAQAIVEQQDVLESPPTER
jgi:AmiR/NasT family two-component response regulator